MGTESVQLIFNIRTQNAQLVRELKAFVGGLTEEVKKNTAGMKDLGAATDSVSKTVSKVKDESSKAATELRNVGVSIDGVTKSTEKAKTATKAFDIGIGQLIDSARRASSQITDMNKRAQESQERANASVEKSIQLLERQARLSSAKGSQKLDIQREFAIQDFGNSEANIKRINAAYGAMAKSANEAAVANVRSINALDVAKGFLYAEALQQIVSATKEATVEAALYASRTEQLGVVQDNLARVNGLNVSAVRKQSEAIKTLGITTQEARSTINQMIFAQLDLSKATDLARLAQDAAKVAGVSSSEALGGIVNGITSLQVEVLRTYGIQVQFEQALTRGAVALGKTRETLTDYERSNIALNEVLSRAPRIFGTYEASLGTTAGKMQSLKRLFDEAKNAIGIEFQGALGRTIDILSTSAKFVTENASAFAELAKQITAVGIALAGAKLGAFFGPGGALVGGVAGFVGAQLFLSDEDPKAAALKTAKSNIERLQEQQRKSTIAFQKGLIDDKQKYLEENKKLDQAIQVETENAAQKLAEIYAKEQKNFKPSPARFGRGGAELTEATTLPRPYESYQLAPGVTLSRKQIEDIIPTLGKTATLTDAEKAGLKITPDPAAQFEAVLGAYTQRAKEAVKSAQGSLDRAKEGLLAGEEKIEAQRRDALNRLALEFKDFNATFAKTLKDAESIQDPAKRQALINNVRQAQGQFGSAVSNINKQFDIEIQKERRDVAIAEIQRSKRQADVQSDIQVQAIRQRNQQAQQIQSAQFVFPGQEESAINKTLELRRDLAQQEFAASKARAESDLSLAERVFELNKDRKALEEARANKSLSDLKAEAQLSKDISDAEVDAQSQILQLRRKQRTEQQQILEISRQAYQEDLRVNVDRNRNASQRQVRLAQARTQPGDEQFATNFELKARVQAAEEEYDLTKEILEQQKRAAYEVYQQTGNRVDLEKTIADIRKQEVNASFNLEKQILDARLDKEIQIADIRRAQDQQLRGTLNGLYDALKNRSVGQFAKDYVDQIRRQIFVNLGAEAFRGILQKAGDIIPGQQEIDPVTGKPTGKLTPLGRILQGTPLGVDPAKLAQAQQINALDRNTRALKDLEGALKGASPAPGSGGSAGVGGAVGQGGGGGLSGILGTLGQILGVGGSSGSGGLIIKNANPFGNFFAAGSSATPSGVDLSPDIGLGGALARTKGFFGPKYNAQGKQVFSAGQTGLAAALALPGIIGGIREGGAKGILGAASGALGVAASIPGPQQPFVLAASLVTGLFSGLFKGRAENKQKMLDDRLSQKFSMPESINYVQDLAGNAIDYDQRGKLRTFNSQKIVNVNVNTMDAKSFMDNSEMIAEASRYQYELGHPLRATIANGLGAV